MLLLSQIIFNGRELNVFQTSVQQIKLIKALGKEPHIKLLVLLPKEKFFYFDPSKYLFLEKITGIPIF